LRCDDRNDLLSEQLADLEHQSAMEHAVSKYEGNLTAVRAYTTLDGRLAFNIFTFEPMDMNAAGGTVTDHLAKSALISPRLAHPSALHNG